MPKIKFYLLSEDSKLPTRANTTDSGYDLYASERVIIQPGQRAMVHTGVSIKLPPRVRVSGYDGGNWLTGVDLTFEAQVRPKSGLALKKGITVLNTPGTIDNGYTGEICVIVLNTSDEPFVAEKHKKIAQLVVCPIWVPSEDEQEVVQGTPEEETARGAGGFGSTGLD